MKTIFTLLLLLFCMISVAQDKIFIHTATAENTNIRPWVTILDHPDLNGNPNANVVFVHNLNGGGGVKYNDNVDGLWYDGTNWTIYNEDSSKVMVLGAQFNVYIISDPANAITHVATAANTSGHMTTIDNPLLNGTTLPFMAMSHYYNPTNTYNKGNFGQFYSSDRRKLFDEGFTPIPEGAAFKILVKGGSGTSRISHKSTAANTSFNYTIIDNPELNGKPNATFVMSHYWGYGGASTQVYLDATLGVWYNGTNWTIYTEDQSNFPENVVIDMIIAPKEVLGVNDNELVSVTMYPNPANNEVNFTAPDNIENVTLYNMMGQKVLSLNDNSTNVQMDVSSLAIGAYLAKIKTGNGQQTLQLIKK